MFAKISFCFVFHNEKFTNEMFCYGKYSKSEKYSGHTELSYIVNDIIKGPD